MDLHKILKYVAYALGVIGAIFALLIMTGSDGMIDNILYVTYVVLFIVIALILIYVVKGIFAGNIKKTLMTVDELKADLLDYVNKLNINIKTKEDVTE